MRCCGGRLLSNAWSLWLSAAFGFEVDVEVESEAETESELQLGLSFGFGFGLIGIPVRALPEELAEDTLLPSSLILERIRDSNPLRSNCRATLRLEEVVSGFVNEV